MTAPRTYASGPALAPQGTRFYPIDALRGVAALSVLAFHLFRNSAQTEVLAAVMPHQLQALFDYSRSGVAIFFVISGFVIGHTTRNLRPHLRDGLAFSFRRQVRLDPPYYVVMVAVVCLALAERLVPGLVYRDLSLGDFVLNMFYLHDIVGADAVLAVAWTLCLEVQFYLVVVLLVLASGQVTRRVPTQRRFVRAAALALGAVSLAVPLLNVNSGPWFIGTWWMFCVGLALSWFMHGHLRPLGMVVILLILALWCALLPVVNKHPDPWGGQWFAYATAVLIAGLVALRRIAAPVPAVLLYFGSISYSLYLVHLPVIDIAMGALFKVTGPSIWGAVVALAAGAVLSIVLAHALQRVVERRSIAWSKRITAPAADAGPPRAGDVPSPRVG